jgi:hypothetical protein
MKEYHKIQTVFLRDPDTNFKTILEGQYAKPEFEWLANNEWIATEKIDGTNIRVMFDGQQVVCNGKTDNAQIHAHLIRYLYEHFTTERMKAQFGEEPIEVCLYGEGFGAGIQSGGYYQEAKDFILFDVKVGDTWLERQNVEDVSLGLNCRIVPILHRGTLPEIVEQVRNGFNSTIAEKEHIAEGYVMRPATELFNRRGERVITKLKYKDFARSNSAMV